MKDKIIFKTLMLKGDAGEPTDQQTQAAVDQYMQQHPEAAIDETIINSAVSDWLDDHPEASTSVQDGSLTYKKLVNGTLGFVFPEMYGAIGDGVTDDTVAIQNAINTGKPVCFMKKTYLITASVLDSVNSYVALNLINNSILIGNGATIQLAANSYGKYKAISINEVSNILIDGLTIICDKNNHTGSTGEQGHGVSIVGSSNIYINNCVVCNCWGDGINISATYDQEENSVMSKLIYINNFETYNNRRQGISVEGCDGLYIDNIYIHDISGTNPQSGIDFEPSLYQDTDKFEYIDNVFISNLRCENASGESIYIEDRYATKAGKYLFSNFVVESFRIDSLDENNINGSEIHLNNVVIKQKSNVYAFEINIKNVNTKITCDHLTVYRVGPRGIFLFDSSFKGKMFFNNVSLLNGDSTLRLFNLSEWTVGSMKNVAINGLYCPDGYGRSTSYNDHKAQTDAVVLLAQDIIDNTQSGIFYSTSGTNVYCFDDDLSANAKLYLTDMFDGYEITVINKSQYTITIARENTNFPPIYYDDLSTSKTIILSFGMVKLKYNSYLNAWIVTNETGSLTAS